MILLRWLLGDPETYVDGKTSALRKLLTDPPRRAGRFQVWLLRVLPFFLLGSLQGAPVLRIACGSSTGGTDAAGFAWQADAYFSGGVSYTAAALASLDFPYRTLRYTAGALTYSLPLPNGNYILSVHLIENRTAASSPPVANGQRKFTITAAGSPAVQVLASSLDLFAVTGSLHPYTITVPITVTAGKILLTETAELGNALISGIEVDSVDVPPPLPFAPYLIGTTAAVPNCPSVGLAFLYVTDTSKLFWCFAGGNWNPVSDVVVGPSIFHLQALDECSGTGNSLDEHGNPVAWSCAGMFRAMISRDDGGPTKSLVGIDLTVSSGVYPPVTWVPAK